MIFLVIIIDLISEKPTTNENNLQTVKKGHIHLFKIRFQNFIFHIIYLSIWFIKNENWKFLKILPIYTFLPLMKTFCTLVSINLYLY